MTEGYSMIWKLRIQHLSRTNHCKSEIFLLRLLCQALNTLSLLLRAALPRVARGRLVSGYFWSLLISGHCHCQMIWRHLSCRQKLNHNSRRFEWCFYQFVPYTVIFERVPANLRLKDKYFICWFDSVSSIVMALLLIPSEHKLQDIAWECELIHIKVKVDIVSECLSSMLIIFMMDWIRV